MRALLRLLRKLFLPLPCRVLHKFLRIFLWGNDTWASAFALRSAQQPQQTQIPFWNQQRQGSEVWPHSCQSQSWQAPRWTLGMTSAHPPTPRGISLNSWQSPLHHLQPGMRRQLDSWVSMSVDKTTRLLDGIRAEPDINNVNRLLWKSRPRSISEMGFSGSTCSTETVVSVFGDMTQVHLHGVKLYKSLTLLVLSNEAWQISSVRSRFAQVKSSI